MKLTSKGRYAVMALVDLARFNNINPVSLRDISLRQGISLDYLEQIFLKLRKKEIVQSVRGNQGGYILNKKAKIKNHPFHPTDIKKTWANIEKAKELLDWKPEISIDEGIESVINWYLDNEKIASKINLYF